MTAFAPEVWQLATNGSNAPQSGRSAAPQEHPKAAIDASLQTSLYI
jgi:hypothetical protein